MFLVLALIQFYKLTERKWKQRWAMLVLQTEKTVFPTLSYPSMHTSTDEIPTLSYNWSLTKNQFRAKPPRIVHYTGIYNMLILIWRDFPFGKKTKLGNNVFHLTHVPFFPSSWWIQDDGTNIAVNSLELEKTRKCYTYQKISYRRENWKTFLYYHLITTLIPEDFFRKAQKQTMYIFNSIYIPKGISGISWKMESTRSVQSSHSWHYTLS